MAAGLLLLNPATAIDAVEPRSMCALSRLLWGHAQQLLGEPVTANTLECGYLSQFYGRGHTSARADGKSTSFCVANEGEPAVVLVYLREFKCANNFFTSNLFQWGKQMVTADRADASCLKLRSEPTPDDDIHRDPWGRRAHTKCQQCDQAYRHAFCEYCIGGYYSQNRSSPCVKDRRCTPSTPRVVFTVVRDPVERFMSGYGEVMHRWVVEPPSKPELRAALPAPRSAREFLTALLRGTVRFPAAHHLFSMLGPINAYVAKVATMKASQLPAVPDLIGALPALDAFRAALATKIAAKQPGVTWSTPDSSEWSVLSNSVHVFTDSNSNSSFRHHMAELFDKDELAASAIQCAVTLPDILCLGEQLPVPECPHLQLLLPDNTAPRTWPGFVAEIKAAFCPWKSKVAWPHSAPEDIGGSATG